MVLEKTLESPLDCREIKLVHPKGNQSWIFIGRTDAEAETPILLATWCEELTHWKRPWCWERLKAGEGEDRGWDGWMASLTQWIWVWVSSRSWWWIGKPGVLQSKESQRVGHDRATELNWTEELYARNWGQRSTLIFLSCFTFNFLIDTDPFKNVFKTISSRNLSCFKGNSIKDPALIYFPMFIYVKKLSHPRRPKNSNEMVF